MKNGVTIALIVVGGCLLFGPVLVNVYTGNKDKDRVAEFYTRNTNAAVLPRELAPSGYGFPEGVCSVVGVIMVGIGVWRSRAAAPIHPA